MPIKILLPSLSPTMLEGNIAKWLKKEGDKVSSGEVLAEIETDKAVMEVEATDEGVLAKIIVPEGSQNIPVNSLIAVLLEDGEDESGLEAFIADNSKIKSIENKSIENKQTIISEKTTSITENVTTSSRIFASPLAKRLASISNVNLQNIQGSGPYGRIVKADVLSFTESDTKVLSRNTEEYYTVPNNNVRKIIAKRLLESKQTIPHFYLSIECNIDKLLDIREDINKSFGENKSSKISVNDFVISAVAKALQEVPAANASWAEEGIRYYNNIDISVAVAVDGGLITPVIKNADQKSITDLSKTMKALAVKARENKLTPEEFQGGGFTISNLGMYGIKNFSAIINPPQSCILAIGASSKRPIVINDQLKIATIMDVTLSSDHRVVDGAVGAQFLASFKKFIESPALLLL